MVTFAQGPAPGPFKADELVDVQFGPQDGSVEARTLVKFKARPAFQMLPSTYPAVRGSGSEADRGARTDVLPLFLDSFHGGFKPDSAILPYGSNKIFYRGNDGVYGTWLPGKATKAYKPTTQADLISVDASAYRSGNKRVHSVMWPTSSGLRWIGAIGAYILTDTSTTNPALKQPSTADNVSDNVLAMWIGPVDSAGTEELFIGSDGQTDDCKSTADPTADSISWTSRITYSNANDRIWWGFYSQTLKRHIVAGVINDVAGIYAFDPATASYPLTSSTLQPVVWTDTKDQLGDIAAVTLGATAPSGASFVPGSGDTGPTSVLSAHGQNSDGTPTESQGIGSRWDQWSGLGNLVASDDSRATATFHHTQITAGTASTGGYVGTTQGNVQINSDILVPTGYNFTAIPLAAQLTGAVVAVERVEAASGNDITIRRVQLFLDGSPIGENRADGSELPTSEASASYGSSTDFWGVKLTGDQLQRLTCCVQYKSSSTANSSGTVSIDTITLNPTYQFPGYKTHVNEGSWGLGEMPSAPGVFVAVEPETDDATGINVPRRLAYYNFSLDGAGNRITLDRVDYPDTQAPYVGDADFLQGGTPVAVGANSGLINHVKLVKDVNTTVNLNYHGKDVSDEWEVYKLYGKGTVLLEDANTTDSDDAQLQCYEGSNVAGHYAVGVKQSLSGTTIAAKPLYWAEHAGRLNLQQNVHYRFFPHSTTGLSVEREFVPWNMYDDPNLFNTSQTKTDSAVSITSCELDYGAGESIRALTALMGQSRMVDDGTLYGTERVRVETDGDVTVASPAVDFTIGSDVDPFAYYNVAASEVPGKPMQSSIFKLTAASSTSSAKTPNLLPVLTEAIGKFKQGRRWAFQVEKPADLPFIVEQIQALELATGNPVQRLHVSSVGNKRPSAYSVMFDDQNYGAGAIYFRESQSGGTS